MKNILYKWQESIIKKYIYCTKGKSYTYAYSYWPYIKYRINSNSSADILFKNRLLVKSQPFTNLHSELYIEKCYILGSGPSIKKQDLSCLRDKPVITLNGSITAAKQYNLKPILHCIIDATFICNKFSILQNNLPPQVPLGLSPSVLKALVWYVPELLKNHPVYLLLNPLEIFPYPSKTVKELNTDYFITNDNKNSAFSIFPQAGLFDGGTVMSIAIQLSYYMGFKKTFLLGLDISNANQPRFYEKQGQQLKCGLLDDYENKILPFMTLTANIFNKTGRLIYNCSPVSKLPYSIIPYAEFPVLGSEKNV